MRELNDSACDALYTAVVWSGPGIVATLVVLAVVNVMVVLGNVLVIAAVYHSIKLRNVTNMFIVSLAVADLMVGVAVLPFSATWEVFKVGIALAIEGFCYGESLGGEDALRNFSSEAS